MARKPKAHKKKLVKLSDRLVAIAENSLNNATATIELGLRIIDFLAKQAAMGDEDAIALLAKFGVEAKTTEVDPIVVYKSDGEVTARICFRSRV